MKATKTFNLETLRRMLLYAKYNDRYFDYSNYLFVIGIDIINQFTHDIYINCKEGSLFGIKVCIDYNDTLAMRLFKEV